LAQRLTLCLAGDLEGSGIISIDLIRINPLRRDESLRRVKFHKPIIVSFSSRYAMGGKFKTGNKSTLGIDNSR